MPLQSPLMATVSNANTTRVLALSDLEFSRTARGGFQAATFSVPAWATATMTGLDPMSRVRVTDSRSTDVHFEGYLDMPGRTVSREGHRWEVGAVGAASVLGDRFRPYIAIDKNLDSWVSKWHTPNGATAELGSHPNNDDKPAWVLSIPDGLHVTTSTGPTIVYEGFNESGQALGGIGFTYNTGISDANYRVQVTTGPSGTLAHDTFTTLSSVVIPVQGAAVDWPNVTDNRVTVRLLRSGGSTIVANTTTWAAIFDDFFVRPTTQNIFGVVGTAAGWYNASFQRADGVIIDALWKFCDDIIDIPNADIDRSWVYQIDQMAYPTGVRFSNILDDLALLEPDMAWSVGPTNPAGKHSFQVYRWPTETRYVVDTRDGWSAPGSESTLANRFAIRWKDLWGHQRVSNFTVDVPELDQWGRIRNADPIDLGDEVGSVASVTQIGINVTAQLQNAANAGTVTVARPILDRYTGRMVMPWELQPGCMVDVRDVDMPAMRCTEMSFSDSAQAATLTLGDPAFSPEDMLRRINNTRPRPRRR